MDLGFILSVCSFTVYCSVTHLLLVKQGGQATGLGGGQVERVTSASRWQLFCPFSFALSYTRLSLCSKHLHCTNTTFALIKSLLKTPLFPKGLGSALSISLCLGLKAFLFASLAFPFPHFSSLFLSSLSPCRL